MLKFPLGSPTLHSSSDVADLGVSVDVRQSSSAAERLLTALPMLHSLICYEAVPALRSIQASGRQATAGDE